METHWQAWHRGYEDPDSSLSRRLKVVQDEVARVLDGARSGALTILSLCAGDGRDVLEVLARHPRGEDTETVLVDLDAGLIDEARERARRLELAHVSCLVDDAGLTRSYAHLRPVDLVLACGIFGNISEQDVGATIAGLSTIVASRGSVVWTRHRRPPDQTPTIRALFEQAGFEERSFVQVRDSLASVGRHQLVERPSESGVSARLFTFVGDGSGAAV